MKSCGISKLSLININYFNKHNTYLVSNILDTNEVNLCEVNVPESKIFNKNFIKLLHTVLL